MWLIRKLAVGSDSPAVISLLPRPLLPSPLSALWLGLESQKVKSNLRDVCSSYPASSFPCQGYQPHAFVISSWRSRSWAHQSRGIPVSHWCHSCTDRGQRGCSSDGLLRQQHPWETWHRLIDIFSDSFNLGRCLQKQERNGGKEWMKVSFCYQWRRFHFAMYLFPTGYFLSSF